MTFEEIVERVSEERTKQFEVWSDEHDAEHVTNDWIVLITEYASRASFALKTEPHFERAMIQVAALAFAALESVPSEPQP